MFLYKIISRRDWLDCKSLDTIKPQLIDTNFIHLCESSQIDRIIAKYWQEVKDIVVLKIIADKLHGNLVKETNPGGSTEYYHLYNGSIPTNSVTEVLPFYSK